MEYMSANQHLGFLANYFFRRVKADDFSQEGKTFFCEKQGKTLTGWFGLGHCKTLYL
jgi:hypothetical protein